MSDHILYLFILSEKKKKWPIYINNDLFTENPRKKKVQFQLASLTTSRVVTVEALQERPTDDE